MRLRPLRALVVLPLALTVALTGCASDDGDGAAVASVGGEVDDAGSGSGTGASLSPEEMGVRFAQCMRENGVDMEDPEPGGPGIVIRGGSDPAVVEAAMEACREFNPQANGSGEADPEAEENAREFAGCMRENGVEAFPDPEPGQRGVRINREIAEDPDFEAAQEACQDILSAGGPATGGR
ncbi:hypothetical protein [Allostreptomyces psammosilenae]|uniref:Uncharacterized protein n=1 Tax=Allostreptomyces psammosilenae TaxID=1892865 RepID=A0A852ZZN6_9ACTN|nr:hypothetical protein [Allostreptomyces psammosilenae]NYI07575.1 hypothetical protein [Allostreptomyces psammosilenae]